MGKIESDDSGKKYDLEERTFKFAFEVRLFIKNLPKTVSNIDDARQLGRSSGSIGANYIEANENLGNKDFLMRIRISRKEAKESIYWLKLIETKTNQEEDRKRLIQEATELMLIFGSILKKFK